jgi:hypothetical protein
VEDGDTAVWLITGLAHELHTVLAHVLKRGLKMVDAEKKPHATSELLAYSSFLNFAISLRKQKRRSGVGRPDHNPPFRPTIVRERRQILEELESELLDKETRWRRRSRPR